MVDPTLTMDETVPQSANTDVEGNHNPTSEPQGGRRPPAQIARYDMFFNQRTFRYELRKTHKPMAKNIKAIILVKRLIDARGQLSDTIIEIHQEALRQILLHINRDVEGFDLSAQEPSVRREVLFCSREPLEEWYRHLKQADRPEDQEKLEGVGAALRFIEEDLRPSIEAVGALLSQGRITYDYVWALIRPNTYVYTQHSATGQHFVAIARVIHYRKTTDGREYIEVECDIIVHDDLAFGLSRIIVEIPRFSGACSILDMVIYPFSYHPAHDAFYQTAVSRGRRYATLRLHFCEHAGVASVHINEKVILKLPIQERVMVDVESFFESQPHSRFRQYVNRELDPEELTDTDFLICTPVLLGFCFTTKAWGVFAIDRITDVQWSEEPFSSLVLGHKQKTLISSLVREHTSQSTGFDDVVAGKGKGLVGLLCGNPGCGKTLTAEAVAETTHKPLYTISAGELGTSPEYTDDRLRRILLLGQRWNAVVLLDEADVFLQERDKTDVSRNALVSIFLRQIEYHPGILIFTTNLVDQIDPAFESRIHFCVKYPDLDLTSRKAIWRTFLSKAGIAKGDVSERELLHLAQAPLNGRQIKNVVGTAKSIASAEWKSDSQGLSNTDGIVSSEVSKLKHRHVQIVLDVMQDWRLAKSERVPSTYPIILSAAGIICALVVLALWHCRAYVSFFI